MTAFSFSFPTRLFAAFVVPRCFGSPSRVFPADSLCHSGIFVLCCVSLTCEVQEIECDRGTRLPLEFVWRREWVQRRRNMRLLLTVGIN